MNPSIMTPTDPGNDPTQYPGNFASFVYAPAFVPPMPTTPITSAGAPQVKSLLIRLIKATCLIYTYLQNYVVYSPMVQPPTPQPVVTISSTNSSTTNTFNSSGSM